MKNLLVTIAFIFFQTPSFAIEPVNVSTQGGGALIELARTSGPKDKAGIRVEGCEIQQTGNHIVTIGACPSFTAYCAPRLTEDGSGCDLSPCDGVVLTWIQRFSQGDVQSAVRVRATLPQDAIAAYPDRNADGSAFCPRVPLEGKLAIAKAR